jgi:hypothetical protein
MIKFPGLLAIAFLSLPLSVNAAIIDIEYSGYVSGTEGNGLGFNSGDTVNGTLRIDTKRGRISMIWCLATTPAIPAVRSILLRSITTPAITS